MALLLLLLGLVFAPPGAGSAPDQVLVLEPPDAPAPQGFLDALRIELAGSAEIVEDSRPLSGATAGARIADASARVVAPIRVAVWLERSGDDWLLYAVGAVGAAETVGRERALVDAFRQPATGGPEADRALALKVHEVLDHVRLAPRASHGSPVVVPPPPATDGPVQKPPPPESNLEVAMELVTRGLLGSPGGQVGAGFGIAAGVRRRRISTDVYALTYVATGLSAGAPDGEVEARELGAGIGARAVLHVRDVSAGGGIEVTARRVHARGTTMAGASGADTVWIPAATPFAEARYQLTSSVSLRGALGLDVALTRHRFSVNDVTVLDLGRARTRFDLSLILKLR